jgi:hypothetical protein
VDCLSFRAVTQFPGWTTPSAAFVHIVASLDVTEGNISKTALEVNGAAQI